jgi:AcrR family transcriptional regulator
MNVRNSRTPSRRRRTYDSDASREAIVDAAMRQFAAHGFAATRVEDIVEAAGYTRGAFYFHFANKLDCFWAVVERREELRGDWVGEVVSELDPDAIALPDLLRRVFAHFARAERGVGDWVLVMVDFFQQHAGDSEVQRQLPRIYRGWHRKLVRFVVALQEGGWVPADRDAKLLATQIFAYTEGLTVHRRLYGLPAGALETALVGGLSVLLTCAA